MNTPAQDTAIYLAAQSGFGALGGSAQWSVFIGREPIDTPVDVVTVYDTGGQPPALKSGPQLRYPSIQVRVRAADYSAGWQKANDVMTSLFTPTGQIVTGGVNVAWTAQGDINYIGRNDKDRALFTINYQMIRDPD
jgi:hypothetical protein